MLSTATPLIRPGRRPPGATVAVPPSGARVTGRLPDPAPLWLTSLQAPAWPMFHKAFRGTNGVHIEPTYGQHLFEPSSVMRDFAPGMNTFLHYIKLGGHQGSYEDRPFKVFIVNDDGSEDLIVYYEQDETYVDGYVTYPVNRFVKRLRYEVKGNAYPDDIIEWGEYNDVPEPVVEVVKTPLGNHTGVNIHIYSIAQGLQNPNERDDVDPTTFDLMKRLKVARFYRDWNNIERIKGDFRHNKDYQGYPGDQSLRRMREAGCDVVVCVKEMPDYLQQTYPDPYANFERIPVPYGADRLLEASWADWEEFGFQYAARYGRNKNIPLSQIKSREGYFYPNAPDAGSWTKEVGLDLVDEMEDGNERDKTWKERESHATPREAAVGHYCFCRGVKRADPTMRVSMGGLAYARPDYWQEFVYWCMKLYGFIPNNRFPYHSYSNTADSQQYSGQDSRAMVIELSAIAESLLPNILRSHGVRFPTVEKPDCGETGTDWHPESPLHAEKPAGYTGTIHEWIANMYARTTFYHAKHGVNRTHHYEWNDNPDPNAGPIQFATMGFANEVGTAPNKQFVLRPKAYQLCQIQSEFGTYTHELELNAVPLVDRWGNPEGKKMLSAYYGTESGQTGKYSVVVGAAGAKVYRLSNTGYSLQFVEDLTQGVHELDIDETILLIILN